MERERDESGRQDGEGQKCADVGVLVEFARASESGQRKGLLVLVKDARLLLEQRNSAMPLSRVCPSTRSAWRRYSDHCGRTLGTPGSPEKCGSDIQRCSCFQVHHPSSYCFLILVVVPSCHVIVFPLSSSCNSAHVGFRGSTYCCTAAYPARTQHGTVGTTTAMARRCDVLRCASCRNWGHLGTKLAPGRVCIRHYVSSQRAFSCRNKLRQPSFVVFADDPSARIPSLLLSTRIAQHPDRQARKYTMALGYTQISVVPLAFCGMRCNFLLAS